MKNIRHWTPIYIFSRIKEILYQRKNKDLPWLTQEANNFLSNYIRSTDIGIEFGSGRSTLWFASRANFLLSVEHDQSWYESVSKLLTEEKFSNVDYRFMLTNSNDEKIAENSIKKITTQLQENHFDFALIDGIHRDICTLEAIRIIRPGGILVIDNVNRHLPSNSHSPHSIPQGSAPENANWVSIADQLQSWRSYWTTSGVTDTAIYFKPTDALP